jgi:hypothetical protein
MEFLLILLIQIAFMFLAYKIGVTHGLWKAAKIIEKIVAEEKKPKNLLRFPVLFGDQSDTDIIIRKDDGTFVCQSATLAQSAIDVLARLKINAATVIVGEAKYWFINNQVFDWDDSQVADQLIKAHNGNKNT